MNQLLYWIAWGQQCCLDLSVSVMSVNLTRSSPLTSLASAAPSLSASQSALSSSQLQCRPCYERNHYISLQGRRRMLFAVWLNFSQNTTRGWIFLCVFIVKLPKLVRITLRAQEFIARMNKFPAEVQSLAGSLATQCLDHGVTPAVFFNRRNIIMQS